MTRSAVSFRSLRNNLGRSQFLRYMAVSVLALLVDVGTLYLLAVRLSVNAPIAGALAYSAGLVVHYTLAISRVFGCRRFEQRPAHEFILYALSGVLGVALSYLVLLAGERIGAALWSAKAVAVVISFTLSYALRRWFLFSRTHGAPQIFGR